MASTLKIRLTFTYGKMQGFSLLLQSGFFVRVSDCGTIRSFLIDQMGLSPEVIDGLIQSVFLDGRPVDDLDSGRIHDGSVLALSAAMPGLVGATMRRGGYYACLRSGISHREATRSASGAGEITVKLFNLVASELGPDLLACGLRIRTDVLVDFLQSRAASFWEACEQVALEGRVVGLRELLARLGDAEVGVLEVREAVSPSG